MRHSASTNRTCFGDLFGPVPDPLRPYLLSFRHALVDLARIEDGDLSRHIRLRAFLKALKYSQRSDLPERVDIVLAEIPHLNRMDVVLILNYSDGGPVAALRSTADVFIFGGAADLPLRVSTPNPSRFPVRLTKLSLLGFGVSLDRRAVTT